MTNLFLPDVPEDLVRAALSRAGGNEIASGKFAHPHSSAALAANALGWFIERPHLFPPLPGLEDLDWSARRVVVERQMRFPWSGGRHPWLDGAVETHGALVGIESKRFEPFRDRAHAVLADAYWRETAWGAGMAPWQALRNALRDAPRQFRHIDAAQLVKHALGLASEARRMGEGKAPILVYLHAEPESVDQAAIIRHRVEAASLAAMVQGAWVRLVVCRWRDWLEAWQGPVQGHAQAVLSRFAP